MNGFSVEISTQDIFPAYVFKIRDISASGMGILVKDDSAIINHLNVGEIIDLKYLPIDGPKVVEYLKTEIKQVTKEDKGRFKGHYVVGLSLL